MQILPSVSSRTRQAPEPEDGRASSPPARGGAVRDRKLAEAQGAVAVLKGDANRNAQAKAVARKKIEELKERLRALRMLFAADPKGMARAAAALAKELGAAVKDYQAAGGSAGEVSSFGDSVVADAPPEAGGAEAKGSMAEPGPNASDTKPAEDAQAKAANAAYQKTLDRNGRNARSLPPSASPRADEDRAFADEARKIARQLKTVIDASKQDRDGADEAADAAGTLNDVDRDLAAIAPGGETAGLLIGGGNFLTA